MWLKRSGLNVRLPTRYARAEAKVQLLRTQSDTVLMAFLGQDYKIPPRLQLQIMTPILRSFPQRRPFFVNMYTLGDLLLSLCCKTYLLTMSPHPSSANVNLANFANLEVSTHLTLTQQNVIETYVQLWNLPQAIIFRTPHQLASFDYVKCSVECLKLLVGAIHLVHGQSAAMKFVHDRIITGRSGLYMISSRNIE